MEPGDLLFPGLKYSQLKSFFTNWCTAAGIFKNITFHSFRHTFVTLQLELGTDIYTVSKLLGHRSLKNTEIYAKIVDKTKRQAAARMLLKDVEDESFVDGQEKRPPIFILHLNEEKLGTH